MRDIWAGLSQEEQTAPFWLQSNSADGSHFRSPGDPATDMLLHVLGDKGFCIEDEAGWRLFSLLFADYVVGVGGASLGKIWLDETTGALFQSHRVLEDLTPKERTVLCFFVEQPQVRHTYTDVIVGAWDDEERYHGVTNDNLFQVISGLRRKVEPNPSVPIYVVNYRDKPEGGYLFYPGGKPR